MEYKFFIFLPKNFNSFLIKYIIQIKKAKKYHLPNQQQYFSSKSIFPI
ncbi:hypothetical protein HMPREF9108_00133 [Leptotrichia sp. oral taxon 225 str. F0581]|nr:hypothetical protein HMPREF9108_00133 [Leptotrichia sp. oral taxon 225 str. F0581]